MARIRTIKPDFFDSPNVAKLTHSARLFFIGVWCQADDEGRLLYLPRTLATVLFPHEPEITQETVRGWVKECEAHGMLTEYSVSPHCYLHVCNFLNHQKINRPSQSRLPPPPANPETAQESDEIEPDPSEFSEPSVNTHGALSEPSLRARSGIWNLEKEKEKEFGNAGESVNADQPYVCPVRKARLEALKARLVIERAKMAEGFLAHEFDAWFASEYPSIQADIDGVPFEPPVVDAAQLTIEHENPKSQDVPHSPDC